MNINLSDEVRTHLTRVTNLADEAANDMDQGFQSRAAAMASLTTVLHQLTKSQEALITMERLQKIEKILIETTKEYLDDEQLGHLLDIFEEKLAEIE